MPVIEIEVPYYYEAEFIPQGKRKALGGYFGGSMTVNIEDLSNDDAPVFLTVENDRHGKTTRKDYRFFDNAVYAAVGDRDSITPGTVGFRHLHDYPRQVADAFEQGNLTVKPDGRIVSIEGSNDPRRGARLIEDRKSGIREQARGFVFIDGILHAPANLPGLVASIDYSMGVRHQISMHLGHATVILGAHGMEFAIDDIESARAWSRDRMEMEGGDGEARLNLSSVRIEVHRPDLVPPSDIMQREAIRICEFLLNEEGDDLREKSDGYIDAWQECRRSVETARADPSEGNIGEMLDDWSRFYGIHASEENERRQRYGSSYHLEDDIFFKALSGVQNRWRDRPISVEGLSPGRR